MQTHQHQSGDSQIDRIVCDYVRRDAVGDAGIRIAFDSTQISMNGVWLSLKRSRKLDLEMQTKIEHFVEVAWNEIV